MNEPNQDIRINLKADVNEAVRNLRELERQVGKLGDLANQGERQQKGFLSPKQVQMYRRIMSEVERTQADSLRRMSEVEEKYNKRFERAEYKRHKQLQDNLKRRQDSSRRAEGDNKWGDVASPPIQEFHRHKLNEAQKDLKTYEGSREYRGANKDTQALEADLRALNRTMTDLSDQVGRADIQSGRIGNLTQQDPNLRRQVTGAVGVMAGATMVTGLGSYAHYNLKGMDGLRAQEMQASNITQKLGTYGYSKADATHRESAQPVGLSNQFSLDETLALQGILATGGITDANKLNKDTASIQGFGRAHAVDPTLMAGGSSLLRQMGTIDEGGMQRFADLIGGAISKNGMGGREEEMTRATVALAQSVGQGLAQLTGGQLGNIVGLQTQVGEVKGLRGERGANMLANLDAGIKNGDTNMDLLMGRGVEFKGFEGQVQLDYLQEEGIANPENITRLLKGSERMFGSHTGSEAEAAMAKSGMTQHEFRALRDAGILDKWKNGEFVSPDEVEKAGGTATADKLRQYSGTETKDFQANSAENRNINTDHSKFLEDILTGVNTGFNSLPDPIQHAIIPGAAILGSVGMGLGAGSMLARGGYNSLTRMGNGTIGGGGAGGLLGGMRSRVQALGGGISSRFSGMGGRLLSSTNDVLERSGNFLGGAGGSVLGKIKLPVIGSALGVGIDRVANPEHSWGRSLAKGVGGTLGGILGVASAGLLGLGTGGVGLAAAGVLGTGGAIGGEKAGDWIYSQFAGEEDKVSEQIREESSGTESLQSSSVSPVESTDTLNVSNLNVNDRAFADYFSTTNTATASKASAKSDYAIDDKLKSSKGENVVRVVVEGGLTGVTAETEGHIKDSFKGYFSSSSSTTDYLGLNLSLDQRRV